jgi:hypothetical protein
LQILATVSRAFNLELYHIAIPELVRCSRLRIDGGGSRQERGSQLVGILVSGG